jgi:hypothetical protein
MNWLEQYLPGWAIGVVDWLWNPALLAVLSAASIALFVASLLAIPWFVARLPADYFCLHRDRPSLLHVENPSLRKLLKVGKNLLGALLLLAGIAMLLLPGQGIITILVSLVLLDFPGKRRFLSRLVARPHVAKTLNGIRRRRGEPPLELDAR